MTMNLDKINEYVDNSRDLFLEKFFDLLRQPSISAQNVGVRECMSLLTEMIGDIGMHVEIMETKGHPVIYAERMVSAEAFTILFYGHYDVQPPDPLNEWISPPFEPTIRDGKIFARGTGDNKGQLLAHLLAVKSYLDVCGELPVNIKFLFEGEEETGSPNIVSFVTTHKNQLKTDLVYTSDGALHPSGAPLITLGVRGIQYIELTAFGARWDNHSGNKGGIVPNPAWILIDLLHTMRDKDGNVLIEGFYDDVQKPDEKMVALIRSLPFDKKEIRKIIGYDAFDMDAETYYRKLMLEPTFNIAGFTSGYGGEGSKTIIPQKATIKADMRLVVDQNPDAIYEKVVAHVKRHAPNVEVKNLGAMQPSRTSPDLDVVKVVTDAVRDAYDMEPILQPSLGGSLPDYVWTKILGVPSIIVPYANADGNNHGPNENIEVEKFSKGIICSSAVLAALGEK
jgi:acetylornithine deacetylase/succinyl-diaminopimelate desuccinylase-like protein